MAFYSSFKARIAHAVQARLHRIYVFFDTSIMHYPQFYLGLVLLTALIGYTYILLFPVLAILGILNMYEALTTDVIDWLTVSIWMVVTIIGTFVSYRIIQVKIAPPTGLKLSEDKAPELFKLLQQLRDHYKRPEIHSIVITAEYELDIIKTPRWGLPIWSSNTMVIGLPVLQCHSREHFICMAERRIGQFSKRGNPVTNWLYQLRSIWHLLHLTYKKNKTFGTELLRGFFYLFASFYDMVSTIAAKFDELKADGYLMEGHNDEVVREMMTADTIYRWYLQNEYWPAVYKNSSISASVYL
jgi:hypothetical protein